MNGFVYVPEATIWMCERGPVVLQYDDRVAVWSRYETTELVFESVLKIDDNRFVETDLDFEDVPRVLVGVLTLYGFDVHTLDEDARDELEEDHADV